MLLHIQYANRLRSHLLDANIRIQHVSFLQNTRHGKDGAIRVAAKEVERINVCFGIVRLINVMKSH